MNIKTILMVLVLVSLFSGVAIAATPNPTTLTNTTGNNWVQWDWVAGAGNVTDSYNISRTYDSTTTWFNTTTNDYIKWTGLGGESVTIVVFAYNTTDSEISAGSVTDTLTVPMMFSTIVNLIAAIVPLFSSILDLIIAVFPLVIAMAFLGGLAYLVNKIFDGALDFNFKKRK